MIFVDFETQSAVNLKKATAQEYFRHPSTRLLSVAFAIDDQPAMVYRQLTELPQNIREALPQHPVVAHNAEMFDSIAWERFFPNDRVSKWVDTIHYARYFGLPASLDGLLTALYHRTKADSMAMKVLCEVKVDKKTGSFIYPVGTPPLWDNLLKYNLQDVIDLRDIYKGLAPYVPVFEMDIQQLNWEINDRGIPIDQPLLKAMYTTWLKVKDDAIKGVKEMTGIANPLSGKQVKDWLKAEGIELPNNPEYSLDQRNLERLMNNPEGVDEQAIAMLLLRKEATRSSSAKLEAAMRRMDDDGRIRKVHMYGGARTMRFSSKGVQFHNLPRGVKLAKTPGLAEVVKTCTKEMVERSAQENGVKASDVLVTMIRSIVKGPITKFDYSNIESRVLAHLAGCPAMMDCYRDPKRDLYCEMASELFGRTITKANVDERQVGKIVVLGCGYQMGSMKFDMVARTNGIDLEKVSLTAEMCVKAFRSKFKEVRTFWTDLNDAALTCCRTGGVQRVGLVSFHLSPFGLAVTLPSNRCIYYRDPRIAKKPAPWDATQILEYVCYSSNFGNVKDLYGGLLAENIVQGFSRDILCEGLIKTRSFDPVLHVHDEIVYLSDQMETIGGLLVSPSAFLPRDFPLVVEGFVNPCYAKSPFVGKETVFRSVVS